MKSGKRKPQARVRPTRLLAAIAVIEDGIDAVDFILNYGRGMKSRVLRLWLQRARNFIANAAGQGREAYPASAGSHPAVVPYHAGDDPDIDVGVSKDWHVGECPITDRHACTADGKRSVTGEYVPAAVCRMIERGLRRANATAHGGDGRSLP